MHLRFPIVWICSPILHSSKKLGRNPLLLPLLHCNRRSFWKIIAPKRKLRYWTRTGVIRPIPVNAVRTFWNFRGKFRTSHPVRSPRWSAFHRAECTINEVLETLQLPLLRKDHPHEKRNLGSGTPTHRTQVQAVASWRNVRTLMNQIRLRTRLPAWRRIEESALRFLKCQIASISLKFALRELVDRYWARTNLGIMSQKRKELSLPKCPSPLMIKTNSQLQQFWPLRRPSLLILAR